MKIQTKAVLLMAVALIAIFSVHTASTYFEVNRQLAIVEDNAVREDLNRTYFFLAADMNQLDSFTLDWSAWDDSYNFMQTKSQVYIDSNLVPATMANVWRVNLAVYADTNGQTFYGTAYDSTTNQTIPIPESWRTSPPNVLLKNFTHGLIAVPEWNSILIVSARPILRSDGTGPPQGTLIFARLLDRQELDLLGSEIHLKVDSYSFDSPKASLAKILLKGGSQAVQPVNQTAIFGYMRLDGVYANPVAILEITEPQLVTQGATSILTPLGTIFALLSVATVGVVYAVVYNVAVEPINRLRRIIGQVDDPKGAPALEKIAAERSDEVGFVAAEIRHMLTRFHQSEAAFKRLVENIPLGFVRTTFDGEILLANPAFVKLLKYPSAEAMLGVYIKDFYVAPEKREKLLDRLSVAGEDPFESEFEFRRMDGQHITVLSSIYQTTDTENQSKYIESISFDITERKKDEAKLAEYATGLEELVRQRTAQLLKSERLATVGRVAAMVAHDIRNPLTAIKLSAYYLKRTLGPNSTAEEEDSLKAIDAALMRANSIVEDLYAYSKEIGLNLTDVDLANVVEEGVRQVFVPSSVNLDVKLPTVRLQADQNRLQRVVINLVKNAVEAMQTGGNLTISGQLDGDSVVLGFEDSGPGMDAEALSNIWQPFTTTKAKGLGLGLAICKRFVEAHGGTISAHSMPTQGTTIVVRLPLKQSGQTSSATEKEGEK